MTDALAILGGGKIGEALLTGLLRGERTLGRRRRRREAPRARGLPRRHVRA